MGSGSSAKYATKQADVQPISQEAQPSSGSAVVLAEKPTIVRAADRERETLPFEQDVKEKEKPSIPVPLIRVTAPDGRPDSPPSPTKKAERTGPSGGTPMPKSPRGSPRSPRGETGRKGSKRPAANQKVQSLGAKLDAADRTRLPVKLADPSADSEDTTMGSSASIGGASTSLLSVADSIKQEQEADRRASWQVHPPPLSGPTAVDVWDTLSEAYPASRFEMTGFASLPRLRPGQTIIIGDCHEKPSLNNTHGWCRDYDEDYRVWLVELEDDRKIRILPPEMIHAAEQKLGAKKKCMKCCFAYGDDIMPVKIDLQILKRREVPLSTEPVILRGNAKLRKEKEMQEEDSIKDEPDKPAVRKRRPGPGEPKKVVVEDPKADEEEEEKLVCGFRLGEMVTFMDARTLGAGKVMGEGFKEGEVLVKFGKGREEGDGQSFSLAAANLERIRKVKEGRRQSKDR